jgi:hypothetical protein
MIDCCAMLVVGVVLMEAYLFVCTVSWKESLSLSLSSQKKVKLLDIDEQGLSYAGTYIYYDQVFIVQCRKQHHINQ